MTWLRHWALPALLLAATLLATPLLLLWPNWQVTEPVVVGNPAPRTVIAPATVQIADDAATDRARREAAEQVAPVLRFDDDARNATFERIEALFDAATDVRRPVIRTSPPGPTPTPADSETPTAAPEPQPPSPSAQVDALTGRFAYLDRTATQALVQLDGRQLARLQTEITDVAQQLMRRRITADELPDALDEVLATELPIRPLPDQTATTVAEPVLREVVQPTVVVDEDATDERRDQAAAAVADVMQTFASGTPVIEAGQEVTASQHAALDQLGLAGDRRTWLLVRTLAGWAAAVLAGMALLRAFDAPLLASFRRSAAVALSATLLAAAVSAAAVVADATGQMWWLAAPVAAPAALAALLTGRAAGAAALLPAAGILPLVLSRAATGPAVFGLLSVAVAAWAVHTIDSRRQLRRSLLWLPPLLAVSAAASSAVWSSDLPLSASLLAGTAAGIVASLLVVGMLPFLEGLLGLPTVTALADLTDRNHPLLRRLEQDAPGTYNHSIAVATLVEAACRAVGANPLMGQVAALYHDIGKTRRPQFFIENQHGINPHDELDPAESARVLHDHVADGVAMADDHQLPAEVVDAIRSHHGTTLVAYFYNQALAADPDADERPFRYPQVEPRSKEATILLVADGCEAATRSAAQKTGTLPPDEIAAIVDRIVQARVDDRQLVRSALTFADLQTVRDTIVGALVNIYHPRINYPPARARR